MNEEEWLACEDPKEMLEFLGGSVSHHRAERLFACACSRRIWHLIVPSVSQMAVIVAEHFADDLATDTERREAYSQACQVSVWLEVASFSSIGTETDYSFLREDNKDFAEIMEAASIRSEVAYYAAEEARGCAAPNHENVRSFVGTSAAEAVAILSSSLTGVAERASQSNLLRDIFGNLFRPIFLDPDWLAPTVTNLAEVAYEERSLPSGELDPIRLAVLSDALEEAGCNNAEILNHLRGPGPHVRGCWVVDLLLGKE